MSLVRSTAFALLPLAAVTFAACSTETTIKPDATAAVVAALIVTPKMPTADGAAVLSAMSAALRKDAGVRYVRPMAGDAHIVYLTAPAQRDQIPTLIERLRASGAFQYVELDSMLKIQ